MSTSQRNFGNIHNFSPADLAKKTVLFGKETAVVTVVWTRYEGLLKPAFRDCEPKRRTGHFLPCPSNFP
jgi:hypothetical protein